MRDTLARTEKFSAAELHDYQRAHLQHFLSFAYAQVPFYRDRLAPLFRRDGTVDWSRWHDVPILTRADIKNYGQALLARQLPNGHGRVHTIASSGTTGEPITVHFNALVTDAGSAALARACRWYGWEAGERFCKTFTPHGIKSLNKQQWIVGGEDSSLAASAKNLAVGLSWPPARILALMAEHRSACFIGNAETLAEVAAAQVAQPADIRLKCMVGLSMRLTERARSLAKQGFNAGAYSAYSSKEGGMMAHECPVSGGFHVNSELVKLEILDGAGKPCALGETGRVIVTTLFNTAQPFIRYEQGDLAAWGEPCACGRSHPVIARIEGRTRDRFRFGGDTISPAIGHGPYRDLLKAEKWQVAQTGALDVEVRFMSAAPDDDIDFAGLTALYRNAYHPQLNVIYRRVTAMPLTAAGKFIDYVNEYAIN